MQVLQNEYLDLFDVRFIHFEWNSPTVTPSVMCFTPNSEVDNNHHCVLFPTMKSSESHAMKSTFDDVYL